MNERFTQLQHWLQQTVQLPGELVHLSGDASFRRYYRLQTNECNYIVMDAPPAKENCRPYIAVAEQFQQAQILVPEILAHDYELGFLLLTDFGDQLLWQALSADSVTHFYHDAFDTLLRIQKCPQQGEYQWPQFTAAEYQRELDLFSDWYVQELRQITLTRSQKNSLQHTFDILIDAALQQPQVCVHRDYHSRNLMVVNNTQLGVLDFQDALWGPITYDLVSLLRDCYIDWPASQVTNWVLYYHQLALTNELITTDNPQQFIRWFDWIGLQRHLKCMGIFSRLALRDHKPTYLQYLPRIIYYIQTTCGHYPEFNSLRQLLDELT